MPSTRTLHVHRAEAAHRDAEPPLPVVLTPEGRPCWYPPDAILTLDDVATLFGRSREYVRGLGIKAAPLSREVVLYLYRDVVAFLEARAA